MQDERSRLQPQSQRERLEDRYGKIGIPAVAAAVGNNRLKPEARQMSAQPSPPAWMLTPDQS